VHNIACVLKIKLEDDGMMYIYIRYVMYIQLRFSKNKKLFVKQRRSYESPSHQRCGTLTEGKKVKIELLLTLGARKLFYIRV